MGAFISPLICGWLAQSDSFRTRLESWGMNPANAWHWGFAAAGIEHTLVGGADVAAELDAKRAIWQATEFAVEY